MPKHIFKDDDIERMNLYLGFGLVNIVMWLFLMIIAVCMMAGCQSSRPKPTIDELKQKFADLDTLERKVPVEIPTEADTVLLTLFPETMPIGHTVHRQSKRLSISARRTELGSLELSGYLKADTIRDTIETQVPVVIFNQCKVEGHLTAEQAAKQAEIKLQEYKSSAGYTMKEIFKDLKWLLILILLIAVALLLRRF